MKNVKWITRIELVDYDFKGYWAQHGWDDRAVPDLDAHRHASEPGRVRAGEVTLGGVTFAGVAASSGSR